MASTFLHHYRLLLLILLELFAKNSINGFVKQLLKSPPSIDNKGFWRRSHYNVAVYGNFTLTLTKSLDVPTPSYLQILEDKTLSVTSFSLLRKGSIFEFDLLGINSPRVLDGEYLWPNELSTFKDRAGGDIMLVPDGFLMPGQSDGGIFAIQDHQQSSPKAPVRITAPKDGWFYHRATYVRLPGGSEGILTARATKPLLGEGYGELVWLILPNGASVNHLKEGNYLEEVVLAQGPDVMFEVFDFNLADDTLEVIAAHFFSRKLSIHSLRAINRFPFVEVTKSSVIDTIGRPYGLSFATFSSSTAANGNNEASEHEEHSSFRVASSQRSRHSMRKRDRQQLRQSLFQKKFPSTSQGGLLPPSFRNQDHASSHCQCLNTNPTHILVTTHECSYDISSAIDMAFNTIQGDYPRVKTQQSHADSANLRKARLGEKIVSQKGGSVLDGIDPRQQRSAVSNMQEFVSGQEFDPDTPDSVSGGSLFAYEIPRSHFATTQVSGNEKGSGERLYASTTNKRDTSRRETKRERDLRVERSLLSFMAQNSDQIPSSSRKRMPGQLKYDNKFDQSAKGEMRVDASAVSSLHNWRRSTIFRGFKVRGWGGIFSPGAPGFPYVFRLPHKPESPPLILLAGDCTGSAYLFAPQKEKRTEPSRPGEDAINASAKVDLRDDNGSDKSIPRYELAFEIECGATVGSAAMSAVSDGTGDVNLYIPAYELNKIHVFRLSDIDRR